MWLFLGTLVVGCIWLAVAPFVIAGTEYAIDHAGGFLNGITPQEVDDIREWRDRQELAVNDGDHQQ